MQTPNFQELADEDAARIKGLRGLSPARRTKLARTYNRWVQILWSEGLKQRSLSGKARVTVEIAEELQVGRHIVLEWAYGGSEPQIFGSVWIELTREPKVMYRFAGFGYATDAIEALPAP